MSPLGGLSALQLQVEKASEKSSPGESGARFLAANCETLLVVASATCCCESCEAETERKHGSGLWNHPHLDVVRALGAATRIEDVDSSDASAANRLHSEEYSGVARAHDCGSEKRIGVAVHVDSGRGSTSIGLGHEPNSRLVPRREDQVK